MFSSSEYRKIVVTVLLAIIVSINNYAQNVLKVYMVNMVGDSSLKTTGVYKTPFEEPFTIRKFKYYISNVQLRDEKEQWHKVSNEYYLVDADDLASQTFELSHHLKSISAIRFLLGVDSIKNVSGVQTGSLDPAKGMFWTWNSGYIVAKLEGKSPVSKALGKYMTYDVGGYKTGENASRWITLPLNNMAKNSTLKTLYIKADILRWFKGDNSIKIAENAVCHEPGRLAMMLADNFSHMFSITKTP